MLRALTCMVFAGTLACHSLSIAAEQSDPVIAEAERRIKQAEAATKEAEAESARLDAELKAAQKRFSFIPQSDAEGKVTLGQKAGELESNLMIAAAVTEAANRIKADLKGEQNLLLIEGDGALDNGKLIAFQVEAFGIEDGITTALGAPPNTSACDAPPPDRGTLAANFVDPTSAGALISALAGMLRSDVELRGTEATATSAQLARALLAQGEHGQFILPHQRLEQSANRANSVSKSLCRMRIGRTAIEEQLAGFGENPTNPEKRKQAQMTLVANHYDEMMTRLTKVAGDSAPPLAAIYMQSTLLEHGTKVLRVWLDKAGGTLLTRRNLWTALGAPAVGVTGGVVASYAKIDVATGKVEKAGFMHCNSELASLRRVHNSRKVKSRCVAA